MRWTPKEWTTPGIAILIAMLAGACASRPDPALTLAASAPGATSVQLLIATTRRPSEDTGLRFSGERSLTPRFAAATISVPKDREPGQITWPNGGKADAETTFAATRFEAVPPEALRGALTDTIKQTGHRHVLIFVHGYNTRFDEAAFRLAQIVHDSRAPVTPVLFSWPSWGTLGAYPYDRESAATARDGLEALITSLAAEPSVSQISLLAHSMGGWLTLETLRQIAIRDRRIAPKLSNVMLAAPDVDVDVAMAQGRALQAVRTRPRITLFTSADDKALSASRLLWGSRDRLGSIDPNKEPYKSNLAKSGVEVLDLTSESSGGDSLNHGKFATAPAIVGLIGRRLAGGQQLHGETSLTETAGAFAQSTVRVVGDVVTAPLRAGDSLRRGDGLISSEPAPPPIVD